MIGVMPVSVEAERQGLVTQSTHTSSMKDKIHVSEVCGL